MSSVIRLRRGTSAQWASSTIVLAVAELGLDTTLNKLKVGNGMHTWPNLPYINVLPSELAELSQDAINSALVMGLHMSKTYDDNANTITIESTLTNVDNTSDANKPISTATATALALKAPLASPSLTGTPTAPTATSGTNTTQIATTEFVKTAIANVIDSAPAALDTLNELAAAINDDASYASTITGALSQKASLQGVETLTNKTLLSPSINIVHSVTVPEYESVQVDGTPSSGGTGFTINGTPTLLNDPNYTPNAQQVIIEMPDTAINNIAFLLTGEAFGFTNFVGTFTPVNSSNSTNVATWLSTSPTYVKWKFLTGNNINQEIVTSISSSEILQLNNVSSNIQDQIDLKAPLANPTFTGTVSGVSKSMVGLGNVDNTSDLNKPVSSATSTLIGALQTSLTDGLASKVDKATVPSLKTETAYTINNQTDRYNRLEFNASDPITLTIPTNLNDPWPIGSSCEIMQAGTGKITVVGQSGVTLNAPDAQFKTRVQWSTLILEKRGENEWLVSGDSEA